MESFKKNVLYFFFCGFVVYFGAVRPTVNHLSQTADQSNTAQPTTNHHSTSNVRKIISQSTMRYPINWQKSSETKPYPNLAKVKNFNVVVSISKNRTYLRDGNKVIYTMYSSAGNYQRDAKTGKLVSATPVGTYYVQQERGAHFYNNSLNEGANYYVSWHNHGEYLFHSVPTTADGSYNLKEAKKLGKSTGSHGCIRLSVPDAQWMMQHLPVGTKVQIKN